MQRKTKFDVVVVGGANSDYTVKGSRLPEPGETVEADDFLEAFGGKGANQAVGCARLGARVVFIGRVGSDARGEAIIKNFRQQKMDIRYVRRDSVAATGAAVIMVDASGEKEIASAPGANKRVSVNDVDRSASLLRSTRVLLMQYEIPTASVIRAAEIARRAGALIIIDPAPARPTPKRLLHLIDVVRPNTSEARTLTGINIRDEKDARRAAQKLFTAGLKVVGFQIGNRGDLLLWPGGQQWLPRLKVKTIDATAAGDAFAAGLAVAIAEGKSFAEAGKFANAAAALATTKLGAQPSLPTRSQVLALLRKHP
jgi:ribokinase